ncbi:MULTISPECIES: lysozyme [unclassified Arthrobacter]|uniref:lysozyme n=1 Tax=unclassified Arthrobacter TaxID=235627 RepID=UPI0027E38552|nr:lysozyme [Arthrobacter sp. MAHUQ-56]
MKRNPSQSRHPAVRLIAVGLLASSLVASPSLLSIASAVEPTPTPTIPSTLPATAQPDPSAPSPPASSAFPEPAPTSPSAPAQSMAEAIGAGGAEMGQRSARVTGSSTSDASRRLSIESLGSEGTWTPTFGVQGLDVSGHQSSVDWQQQWNMGARFAYVKASEGNYYTNPSYSSQYQGARGVGMIRGAYHFAIPNWSSGADQAQYFVRNGGGWTSDGYTMPPVLDFEFNPYEGRTINGFYFGNTCYDMSPSQLQSWVKDFGNTVRSMTGRLPVIYTNTMWWNQCLGDPSGFGDYPLWVAAYPSSPTNNAGAIPTGSWAAYSIWQYSSTGPFAGDSNVWNGDYAALQRFASQSDSSGTSFAKGPNSSTIYMVSGTTKYPLPDWSIYELYMRLGTLQQVSQQYLDSLATGNAVGRFARSADGSIFLIDDGRRLHVPNCTLMFDFGGGNCTGWVPLSSGELSTYSDSGLLSNATISPTGRQFYVSAMTKREFFDIDSLVQAGLPGRTSYLSDAVTALLPLAASGPIVRPDVVVVDRLSRQPYIYTAGKLLPVPTTINAENVWTNSIRAAALDGQSISKIPLGTAFAGFATNGNGSEHYVIGPSEKYLMADKSQWPDSSAVLSDALLNMISTSGTISTPAFVKSPSSPVIFRKDKATARQVPDWATLSQLNLGGSPQIFSLTSTGINELTKGPALLPLGRLVVSDTSPAVYLIDGADKMLQLEDFRISNNLGIAGYSRVPQSQLSPYTSIGTLQPVLRCGLDAFLGYAGALWKLPATAATAQLPARSLELSTCNALPATRGSLDATIFTKALDSPVVYLMVDGTKRPVNSWARLVELNKGSGSPVIAEYSRSALDLVPMGPPA